MGIGATNYVRLIRMKKRLVSLLICMSYASADITDDSEMIVTSRYDDADTSERLVISCFAILCALCLSVVTSIMVYCVYTEDRIVRNFLSNGMQIKAKVVEYTVTNKSRREYSATIDYRLNYDCQSNTTLNDDSNIRNANISDEENMGTDFATIIRQQIKCVESDFETLTSSTIDSDDRDLSVNRMTHERRRNSTSPPKRRLGTNQQHCHHNEHTHSHHQSICIEIQKEICGDGNVHDDLEVGNNSEKFPSFDVAIFNPPKHYYIDIVVLPEYPTSAMGYQQMLHASANFPIIVLIISLSVLTYFCIYITIVNLLPPGKGILNGMIHSIVVLFVLLLIEIVLVRRFCSETIVDMLNNEYKLRRHVDGNTVDDENYYFNFKTEDETLYTTPSSFGIGGGIGGGGLTSASTSWRHSSPNLYSLSSKQPMSTPEIVDDVSLGSQRK